MSGTTNKAASELDGRFIGDLFGSFVFLQRPREAVSAIPFRARSVSQRQAVITAEVEAVRGEAVALRFDTLGIRQGEIERVFKGGFIVGFQAEGDGDQALSEKIDWLKRKTRGDAIERRQYRRVLPRETAAKLILGRDILECQIKDMSQSGAAVLASAQPPIGQLVAIGAVPGHVVRHFPGGFAIRFVEVQVLAQLEGLMTLRSQAERAMAAKRIDQVEHRFG